MTFLCMIELRNKVVAHAMYFSSLFANANNYLCQERLLRSMNFASMVIGHDHTSPLYCYDRSTVNPLSPNIHMQILQTDLYTFL